MHKQPEAHLRVIYKAFYDYKIQVERELRDDWRIVINPIFIEAKPTLSMIALLHQYSWTIEEWNEAILEQV